MTMVWCWRGDGQGDASWEVYSEIEAAKLEAAFQEFHDQSKNCDGTVILQHGATTYICNIASMEQTNLDTGYIRGIHRGWPTVEVEQEGSDDDDDDDDDDEGDEEYNDSEREDSKKAEEMRELFQNSDPPQMTAAAPPSFLCPLSAEIMMDPVMTMAGSTYERKLIEKWLQNHSSDPLTNDDLSKSKKQLIPNRALRDSIQQWRKEFEEKEKESGEHSKKRAGKRSSDEPNYNHHTISKLRALCKERGINIDGVLEKGDLIDALENSNTLSLSRNNPNTAAAIPSPSPATTNPSTSVSPNDLQEGEERIVQGASTNSNYTVKLLRGVYSCSCPAWRFAGGPIDTRSCKHLRQVRGTFAEEIRLSNFTNHTTTTAAKRKEPEPNTLVGQIICFTGALQTMTRKEAQSLARQAGATVTQSVTRSTTVLVVGKRPGVKLSNSDASPNCDTWTEDDFVAATSDTNAGSVSTFSNHGGHRLGGNSHTTPTNASDSENGSIPPRIMLASKFDEKKSDPTGWLLSEKLDGMRAFWDGYARKMWSRQGKAIYTPDWWAAALPSDIYLDGELWLGRGQFQQCMSITRRQNRPQAWDQITFLVFDAPDDLDGNGVLNSNMKEYEARYEAAREAITSALNLGGPGTKGYAKLHPFETCQNLAHLQRKLKEIEAIGGEGLMLRRPQSKYSCGRSTDLLKVKSASDDEAVVTGHENGRGRHAGRLGALQVINRSRKRFKVGSGFTDQERENPPAIGSVITYRYNELTNSGIPRFPVFVRMRPDVQASEITNS